MTQCVSAPARTSRGLLLDVSIFKIVDSFLVVRYDVHQPRHPMRNLSNEAFELVQVLGRGGLSWQD
jgi:hypothetical protein